MRRTNSKEVKTAFSSPLWGFLYLILIKVLHSVLRLEFSSPLWGFLYLILNTQMKKLQILFSSPLWGFLYLIQFFPANPFPWHMFSSPLWGFLYLMIMTTHWMCVHYVLVPSLGISLFNKCRYCIRCVLRSSRPLSGDFFI